MTATQRAALVADAEELCRQELASLLRDEGFEPRLASDDDEAFEIAHQTRVDVVIVQFELPSQGGLDFWRALRGELPPRVPCVLTAREVSPRVQFDAFSEDAFAVVPKPIDTSVMRRVVKSIMRRYFHE